MSVLTNNSKTYITKNTEQKWTTNGIELIHFPTLSPNPKNRKTYSKVQHYDLIGKNINSIVTEINKEIFTIEGSIRKAIE